MATQQTDSTATFCVAIALTRFLPPNVEGAIFEKATKLEEIGASIGISPNGLRSMYKLGIDPALVDTTAYRQPRGYPVVYAHRRTG